MDKIILLFCSFISCTIYFSIIFQFLNDRYLKVYTGRGVYFALTVACIISVMAVNMLMNPMLNLTVNVLLIGLISAFFYYEDNRKRYMRILESEALFVITGVSEALGVFLINTVLHIMHIMPESMEIQKSIETAFSKIMLLFLYYVVFSRLWKKNSMRTMTQYILYLIMFIYSIVNVVIIAVISDRENPIVLMIIVSCVIFANMYLLFFIKFTDERNYYKLQVDMMEQQEKLQYANYVMQSERYREAVAILHDVDKHIKMVEELHRQNMEKEALGYTKQIRDMLKPLVPYQYSNNPVLNCLLSDKKKAAEKLDITFDIDVLDADISFMKPMDITTLFGNLIDNALTACKDVGEGRYIGIHIKEYKEMISIRIENSIELPVPISDGKIETERKGKKGIGLLNVQRCVDKYEGNIIYKSKNQCLVCDIFLNRIDNQKEG